MSSKHKCGQLLCSAGITKTNICLKVSNYLPLTLTDFPPISAPIAD